MTTTGLASGRVTKEDLAAGYLEDKAISIGLKAIPGAGASLAYKALKKTKLGKYDAKIMGHTDTLRNPSQIDNMKQDMLDGNYRYDSPEGIISGAIDEKGVMHIGEGQHRVNAALEIFEETGDRKPLNNLVTSSKNGVDGRYFMPQGKPSWEVKTLPRRSKKSWWKFW
ncbi:hypothetical protein [Motilimonas cestriensis]|uniref:hypothetical protein n=1 Tax=Motilimonas cestriensis TaxID=2742685 RepID=UPI003DA268DA